MGEILLIAADWQFRALVRAQLLEEGHQVRALPSLEIALAHLIRSGERPQLIVVDVQGREREMQLLSNMCRLTSKVPLILCGGALSQSALERAALLWVRLSQEELPAVRVLLRPFRVRDLVAEVRSFGAWPKDTAVTDSD